MPVAQGEKTTGPERWVVCCCLSLRQRAFSRAGPCGPRSATQPRLPPSLPSPPLTTRPASARRQTPCSFQSTLNTLSPWIHPVMPTCDEGIMSPIFQIRKLRLGEIPELGLRLWAFSFMKSSCGLGKSRSLSLRAPPAGEDGPGCFLEVPSPTLFFFFF